MKQDVLGCAYLWTLKKDVYDIKTVLSVTTLCTFARPGFLLFYGRRSFLRHYPETKLGAPLL